MSQPGAVTHYRRLKVITFTLAGISYECQLNSWQLANNTADGTKMFSFCQNSSEFRTETDNDYALQLKFFADWRPSGISTYLWNNARAVVAFQLDHLPDIVGEHVRWTGNCVLKAPTVGGDVRMIEETSVTLLVLGVPAFTAVG